MLWFNNVITTVCIDLLAKMPEKFSPAVFICLLCREVFADFAHLHTCEEWRHKTSLLVLHSENRCTQVCCTVFAMMPFYYFIYFYYFLFYLQALAQDRDGLLKLKTSLKEIQKSGLSKYTQTTIYFFTKKQW